MKINNPQITMLINSEYTKIEIRDSDSVTILCEVKLTPEQLSTMLSRQVRVDCECETGDLSRIGKKHENRNFEFEFNHSHSKEELSATCDEAMKKAGLDEWVPDNYYGSRDSFFKKDDKFYARVTIRRWV